MGYGGLASTEIYHFCSSSIEIIARFGFRSLFCSLKFVMGSSFTVHDCRSSQVSVDPLFKVCACKDLNSVAEMVPVAPALCSGTSTWSGIRSCHLLFDIS